MGRRENGRPKKQKSLSISQENARWLEEEHSENQSAFVDEAIRAARDGHTRPGIAGLKARMEALKAQKEQHEREVERLEAEISEVEKRIKEMEENPPEDLMDTFEMIERLGPRWDGDLVDNSAVENHAEKLGMSPGQLLDEYKERRGEIPEGGPKNSLKSV